MSAHRGALTQRAALALERFSGRILLAAALLTGLLVAPMLLLASDEAASTEPGGEVFDLRDSIDESLSSTTYASAYIAEARDGDILTQAGLWELLRNEQTLRERDAAGALVPDTLDPQPLLMESFDTDSGTTYTGVTTIADAVDTVLRLHPLLHTSLAEANDDQVKLAVAFLLDDQRTAKLADQLSVRATAQPGVLLGQQVDIWQSPAVLMVVVADNEALGGASRFTGLGNDEATLNREHFARELQATLRGDGETYQLWGLAIDQNLAAEEQGATAGLFIMLTVIAALAVVGISLRSYWATALTAVGIGALMIWLKGFSALVGIKGGLVVDLIVPIAMVSLGVDFAVHAARRYQEERRTGLAPGAALPVAAAGVLSALVLAMFSDGIAFLSNVPSGIEAVVHFGLAAGIATVSSFLVLGVFLPLALMRIDLLLGARSRSSKRRRPASLASAAGVTALTGTGVIILVAVSPAIGAGILALTALGFVGLPILVLRMRAGPDATVTGEGPTVEPGGDSAERWVSALVVGLASRRVIVLPLAAIVTVASVALALRLEATFDVKDFFSPDSDIVVGLDKLDQHVGDRSGEGGILYLQGDLTEPEALREVAALLDRLAENLSVGKETDGRPSVFERHVLTMVGLVMTSSYAKEQVAATTGVPLTDVDRDLLPDTREQTAALFTHIREHGVPLDETTDIYTPDQVRTALFFDPAAPEETIATLVAGIPGTREQSVIALAKERLLEDVRPLAESPFFTRVGVTGSPFIRDAELTATVDNLRTSLPLAVVGTLILLLIALRSIRYAVVTVIPIGLVVAWLYALMHLFGFGLNFVSATIGAVSVGVGIDYSIHMTVRFREELSRRSDRLGALRHAGRGTGVALLGSAGSSIVGFAIMGFAPMPMFSTYGALTALMIFLALAAALLVLPSLLMLATPERVTAPNAEEPRDG